MAQRTSPTLSVKDSALSAALPPGVRAALPGAPFPPIVPAVSSGVVVVIPDAQAARHSQRHFTQAFKLAADSIPITGLIRGF